MKARTRNFTAALLSAPVLLSACAKPPQPPPTVSWYGEHADALRTKVTWCSDDMQRKATPDCRNALEAASRKAMGTMKDAPPLDWNKPDPKNH